MPFARFSRRRRPLKGGGAVRGYKGNPPPSMIKGLIEKIAGGLSRKLRAGMQSKLSTMVGIGKILGGVSAGIIAIFGGEGVNTELLLSAGIAVIIDGIKDWGTRDAGTSSQDEGTRKDVEKEVGDIAAREAELEKQAKRIAYLEKQLVEKEIVKMPLEILED